MMAQSINVSFTMYLLETDVDSIVLPAYVWSSPG